MLSPKVLLFIDAPPPKSFLLLQQARIYRRRTLRTTYDCLARLISLSLSLSLTIPLVLPGPEQTFFFSRKALPALSSRWQWMLAPTPAMRSTTVPDLCFVTSGSQRCSRRQSQRATYVREYGQLTSTTHLSHQVTLSAFAGHVSPGLTAKATKTCQLATRFLSSVTKDRFRCHALRRATVVPFQRPQRLARQQQVTRSQPVVDSKTCLSVLGIKLSATCRTQSSSGAPRPAEPAQVQR